MPKNTSVFWIVGMALALSACQAQISPSTERWEASMNMRAPSQNTVYVCHAYGCQIKYAFTPSSKDRLAIKAILSKGKTSPEAERKAIGYMVQWFEKRVGPAVGSDKDKGGLDLKSAGIPGQMDCIDEASNTTSYIAFAQKNGWLMHHNVMSPVARGFFLDGRYPHATAVVQDKDTGINHAVDSWKYDNGVYPFIKPLKVWFAEKPAGLSS